MIFDRLKKKKPAGRGGRDTDQTEAEVEVPEIDNVLADIDYALNRAQELSERAEGSCTC